MVVYQSREDLLARILAFYRGGDPMAYASAERLAQEIADFVNSVVTVPSGPPSLEYSLNRILTGLEAGGGGGGGGGTITFTDALANWGPAGRFWGNSTGLAIRALDLDDANDALAMIFEAEDDTPIDRIGFVVTVITGDPPDYNVGVTTVTAGGEPTQTDFTAGSSTTHDFGTGLGFHEITLPTPATPSRGDLLAVHAWPTGIAPDGSNSAELMAGASILNSGSNLPIGYPATAVFSVSWTLAGQVAIPNISYRKQTGSWRGGGGFTSVQSPGFDRLDSPDELGARFTVPATMTIDSLLAGVDMPSGVLVRFRIYDLADAVLREHTYVLDDNADATVQTRLTNPLTLAAGDVYRMTVQPNSDTNVMTLAQLDCASAALRQALPHGASWMGTSRTDGGAWTDDDTMYPLMGFQVSSMVAPAT